MTSRPPCFFGELKTRGNAMSSAKTIASPQSSSVPGVDQKDSAATDIELSERVSGALLCSVDAAIWMAQVGLLVLIWSIKLTLMVGIAVLRIGLRGRR